jgi:hypothetical protein
MTKVIFLIDKPEDQFTGANEREILGVFAYFPEETHNGEFKTCYAHLGQHSACHPDYAKECKEADFYQYQDLLKELIAQGYKDLVILNNQEIEYNRKPTQYELKLGYGATFYRDFKIGQAISKSGDLKQWLIASDDGLRYNRLM